MLIAGAILLAIFVLDAPWSIVVIGLAVVADVAETAFWIWFSKRRRVQAGPEALIGARGVVVEPCLPEGQVRVAGELWRARSRLGAVTGDRVSVRGRDALVLLVEREE
jgi:membrane-bound serine protease (ClpP class)